MGRIRTRRFETLLALGVLLPACAATLGPDRVLNRYLEALTRGDAAAAWTWIEPEGRKYEEFQKQVAQFQIEVRGMASDIRLIRQESCWQEGGAPGLVLIEQQGQWRIDRGPLQIFPRDTPEAALRTFLIAFRRQRFDVLMELVPPEERPGLTETQLREVMSRPDFRADVELRLTFLGPALVSGTAEITGDQAFFRFGPYQASLKRGAEGWNLVDL